MIYVAHVKISLLTTHLPLVKKVYYIGCDGPCDNWFHYICVGLTGNEIFFEEEAFQVVLRYL